MLYSCLNSNCQKRESSMLVQYQKFCPIGQIVSGMATVYKIVSYLDVELEWKFEWVGMFLDKYSNPLLDVLYISEEILF